MVEFYGFDGEPITQKEWYELFEDPKRLLRQEWLHVRDGKRYWVSTVWLGFDHNYVAMSFHQRVGLPAVLDDDDVLVALDTRPWIFETMAFKNEPRWDDVFARAGDEALQVRHATLEEALAFHDTVKEQL